MNRQYLFTSESVSEGHPDKVADQISDAILDVYLSKDPQARVACEVLIKNDTVVLAGEISADAEVDHEAVTKAVLERIGYTSPELGFDGRNCRIVSLLSRQSPQIAQGVDRGGIEAQGAGDQGLMFGYATIETPELMPAPLVFAHDIVRELASLRHQGLVPWLRPDAKSQVTLRYKGGQPVAAETIVVSTQHAPAANQSDIERLVRDLVFEQIIPDHLNTEKTRLLVNPTGLFEIGGPAADAGLTGRKIIVDTYGGMARHGGGAFSGKDPTKVDRSAAYAARHVAVNVVAAGLADRCEIQVSYAIGVAEPVSIHLDSFGTGRLPDSELARLIEKTFDLRPGAIIKNMVLDRPIYSATAAYGHFGRLDLDLPWERRDHVKALQAGARRIRPGIVMRPEARATHAAD